MIDHYLRGEIVNEPYIVEFCRNRDEAFDSFMNSWQEHRLEGMSNEDIATFTGLCEEFLAASYISVEAAENARINILDWYDDYRGISYNQRFEDVR